MPQGEARGGSIHDSRSDGRRGTQGIPVRTGLHGRNRPHLMEGQYPNGKAANPLIGKPGID